MAAPNALGLDEARSLLTAACLLRVGNVSEVEQALAQLRADHPEAQRYRGLALADQGKVPEAIRCFEDVLRSQPADPIARAALLVLLRMQATQKINAREWGGAGSALAAALAIAPEDPQILELAQQVENVLPLAHLKAGRRREAAEAWEKIQKRKPRDGRVAHSLALLYRFWAEEVEGQADSSQATSLWQRAIANWTFARYADEFWRDWQQERGAVYTVSDDAIAHLRSSWGASLGRVLQNLADSRRAEGRVADAERLDGLVLEAWVEDVVGSALASLHLTAIPPCGPLMLRALDLEDEARKTAGRAVGDGAHHAEVAQRLKLLTVRTDRELLLLCLSPAAGAVAQLSLGKLEPAHRALAALAGGRQTADKSVRALFLFAALQYGAQLAGSVPELPDMPAAADLDRYLRPVREALRVWREALNYRDADAETAVKLQERLENLAIQAANEMKSAAGGFIQEKRWADELQVLSAAIDLVRGLLEVVKSQRTLSTVTALYIERAATYRAQDSSVKGLDRAIADLEAALKVEPENLEVKQRAAATYNAKGCALDGQPSLEAFNRAIALDPTNALYYRNRGIEFINARRPDDAIRDLQHAGELQPGPDNDKHLASAMFLKAMDLLEALGKRLQGNFNRPSTLEFNTAKSEARQYLLAACRLDPSSTMYQEALQQLG